MAASDLPPRLAVPNSDLDRRFRFIALAGVVCAVALGLARAARAEQLPAPVVEAQAKYAAQLEELAAWCDGQKLTAEAEIVRGWLVPRDPRKLYLVLPCEPRCVQPLPAEGAGPAVIEWQKKFSEMRRERAKALFDLAATQVREGRVGQGFELLMESLREDPEFEPTRRVLGYRKFRNEWHTAYEIRKKIGGYVWHEKFGWLKQDQVARYEAGMRLAGRRWVSAAEDAAMHRDIRNGWVVETEHFLIATNHSLEAGVDLGRQLERLYQAWQFTFPLYLTTADKLAQQFDSKVSVRAARGDEKHHVVYYRNQAEYVEALKSSQPNIGITTGIYFAEPKRAFFFAGSEHSATTLYHEATHQLFHETRAASPDIGRKANFWFIEGVACYMESLTDAGNGYFTLGGADSLRFQNAQTRLLADKIYVPLAELCGMGMLDLQKHPQISALYAQSAGLSHFLMHYDAGRYRDAVTSYLLAIYMGRDTPQSLAELTRVQFGELDGEYRGFVESVGK